MPKKAKELSAVAVKKLPVPNHAVGGVAGLLLQVTSIDAKSWILRITIDGKRRHLGLGSYPDISLAIARDKARHIKANGVPIKKRTINFTAAVQRYLEGKRHEFKNLKHFAQWKSTLATYAEPTIGHLPVDDIELEHILAVLEPIWMVKTETAKRVQGRIEKVLSWATVSKYRTGENPAAWKNHLDNILPKPSKIKIVAHHPALPYADIKAFMASIRAKKGLGAKALEFLILTATRAGDVRNAKWSDIKDGAWTIATTKTGKQHRVPLSPQALFLLDSVPVLGDYLFEAPRGGSLSDGAMKKVINGSYIDPKVNKKVVPHGFRSTFRDWAEENTTHSSNVIEMALAHAIGNKVEAAYRRGDLFEKRTELMVQWADFCAEN
jgi:integrase